MNIFISGGTGFVGVHLIDHFIADGHHVTAVGTSASHPFQGRDLFTFISGDTTTKGSWQNAIKDADVIVNLAGRNIFNYWTEKYKTQMYDSRVITTRNIVNALPVDREVVLLSTSAAGYYGSRGDNTLNETSSPGDDFLSKLCQDWEKEALRAEEKNARVVIMRFGVVLGKNGGALAKMLPAFKCFIGGPLGDGKHWFPWMHMADLISAIDFLLENRHLNGPVNFCGPIPVRQKDFAKALGNALHRPAFFRVPAFVLNLIMGELGASLLGSQRAVPGRLESEGYMFHFHSIEDALKDLVN